jgi:TPR repeat protein
MRTAHFWLFFSFSIFFISPVSYAVDAEIAFRTASRYYGEQNYPDAIEWFRTAAKAGHAEAKYRLGTMYLDGKGTDKNPPMGRMWFEISAKEGVALAQYKLAEMHEKGIGGGRNPQEAAVWYAKAGEQNYLGAQLTLGAWYKAGEPIAQDFDKAWYWYDKAAQTNHAGAEFELAEMLRLGQGRAVDYAQAASRYQKAADQGHAQAQLQLGLQYEQGQGVAANLGTAAQWYEKAAQQNIAEAQYKFGDMLYQGRGVEQNISAAIDWLQKAQKQQHQAASDALKSITDSTVAELKQLFDKRDYAAVIATATPKRALGGEVSQLFEKAQKTEAALREVPALLQAQNLKQAYDLASQFDDPQLKALAIQAREGMDKAIAELQALHDRKAYDEVIAKGEQIKSYGNKVTDLINKSKESVLISKASKLMEDGKYNEAYLLIQSGEVQTQKLTELAAFARFKHLQSISLGVSYEEVTDYLINYIPVMESSKLSDGTPRLMGSTLDKLATLEIQGDKNAIRSVSLLIGVPNDSPEILTKNIAMHLRLLHNIFPYWDDRVNWYNSAAKEVVASSTGKLELEKDEKLISLHLIKNTGLLILSIKKQTAN